MFIHRVHFRQFVAAVTRTRIVTVMNPTLTKILFVRKEECKWKEGLLELTDSSICVAVMSYRLDTFPDDHIYT
jgi:hypothetical protein